MFNLNEQTVDPIHWLCFCPPFDEIFLVYRTMQ